MEDSYNLFDEPWISALNNDLTLGSYGIKELLFNAHNIIELSEDTPLTKYGIYRLLIALVMDAFNINDIDTLEYLLEKNQFSKEHIEKYYQKQKNKFYLFSDSRPFLQNPELIEDELKKRKKITSLFQFLPTGNNTILFKHTLEEDHKISPKYCAKALCTLAPFTVVGGSGYTASINGTPPWYILIKGKSLFETLLLNSNITPIEMNTADAPVIWKVPEKTISDPISQSSTLQGLTWLPRYVYLFPEEGGICTYNGEFSEILVSKIGFKQGWKFNGSWRDPFVSYITTKKGRFTLRPTLGRKIWRDIGPLMLQTEPGSSTKFDNPIIIQQFLSLKYEEILPDDYIMILEVYGLRTKQAKFLEWYEETLSLPVKVLRESRLRSQIQHAIDLSNKVENNLKKAISQFASKNGHRISIDSVRGRALRNFWRELEIQFKEGFLIKLGSQDQEDIDAPGQLRLEWKKTLRNIGRDVLEAALGEISTNAQFLRKQVETMDYFNRSLYLTLFRKDENIRKVKK